MFLGTASPAQNRAMTSWCQKLHGSGRDAFPGPLRLVAVRHGMNRRQKSRVYAFQMDSGVSSTASLASKKKTQITVPLKVRSASMRVLHFVKYKLVIIVYCILQVAFGEHLKLVGGDELLGGWEIVAAPAMKWNEGHNWSGTFEKWFSFDSALISAVVANGHHRCILSSKRANLAVVCSHVGPPPWFRLGV